MAKNYENLDVWKESIELTILIYKITKDFPKDEMYGIVSQLRRAAISISTNIAEGAGRNSTQEFIRFINISLGSLNEVESLIHVSLELKYIDNKCFISVKNKISKIGNLSGGFKKYLNSKK